MNGKSLRHFPLSISLARSLLLCLCRTLVPLAATLHEYECERVFVCMTEHVFEQMAWVLVRIFASDMCVLASAFHTSTEILNNKTRKRTGEKKQNDTRNKYDKLMKICHIFGTLDCNVAFLFWFYALFYFFTFFYFISPHISFTLLILRHYFLCVVFFSIRFLFVATFSLVWCHFYCHVYRLLSHLYLRLALTLSCSLLPLFLFGLHKSNARKIQIITQTKQIKLFFCSRSTFFPNIFMCLCISTYILWASALFSLPFKRRARALARPHTFT